jgi:hypothetical protein
MIKIYHDHDLYIQYTISVDESQLFEIIMLSVHYIDGKGFGGRTLRTSGRFALC